MRIHIMGDTKSKVNPTQSGRIKTVQVISDNQSKHNAAPYGLLVGLLNGQCPNLTSVKDLSGTVTDFPAHLYLCSMGVVAGALEGVRGRAAPLLEVPNGAAP